MSKKMRVAQLLVLPIVYLDDGENLIPVDVDQMAVPGDMVAEFVNGGLAKALESLREQFENLED